jgi:hypothetical protein
MWKLYNMLPNNQWAKEETKREIFKYLEVNDIANIICQNLYAIL